MSKDSSPVIIHTDGGCDKNPGGTGGWAFVIRKGDQVTEGSGRVEKTTNNRMEMTAAIRALETLKGPSHVELYTDSQYLSRGISEWIYGWIRQNWTLKDGSPVKNADLWKKLFNLNQKHKIHWQWIRGHFGDPYNQRADQLVHNAIKGKKSSGVARATTVNPEVKLIKQKGEPVIVSITGMRGTSGSTATSRVDVNWDQLPGLIEDLVKVLREGEE